MASIEMFEDSDLFWDQLWHHLDKAQDLCFITTYDMDHKMIAAITLQKLTNAAKRGCQVVLIIDDLNYYASKTGINRLKEAGGIVIRNNPFEKAYEHILNGRY
jgi:phosphatidylserine/phosphatidylglycerophosphate/cardiolipin synthase-like enzyme